MNIIAKIHRNLAISIAICYERLIWTAQTIWLALGFSVAVAPTPVEATRNVTNWLRWWRVKEKRGKKEQVSEKVVISLMERKGVLNMKYMVRGP